MHNEFGPWLNDVLGWTPFFATQADSGSTMFTAVLVLAIMIVPITAAISRDLFLQVPTDIKEGAVGLGLTRWEMVRAVILPYTRGGLISAVLLGAGRALGEAIAVTQVIGTTRTSPPTCSIRATRSRAASPPSIRPRPRISRSRRCSTWA